jgi:glycosyltransferase involved in cell wall biosynthesis
MTHFRIFINCGPFEKVIRTCLESVINQSFTNWAAYVTVDPCGDKTFANAVKIAATDPRIHVCRNLTRRYSLRNLVDAIGRSKAGPEDVIAMLDGDDWFASRDALRIIAETYERSGCWMTYGSWLSNVPGPSGRHDGRWPAYAEGTSDFRHTRWLGTAVRTWKKWLWDLIDDSDLRGSSGDYFRIGEDQAIMLPMLEMSGTARAKHIPDPIMVYNKTIRYVIPESIEEERQDVAALIDRRAPYRRLEAKPRRRGARGGIRRVVENSCSEL